MTISFFSLLTLNWSFSKQFNLFLSDDYLFALDRLILLVFYSTVTLKSSTNGRIAPSRHINLIPSQPVIVNIPN